MGKIHQPWGQRVKRKQKPETAIQKQLINALKLQKWMCVPIQQSQFSLPGIADFAAIRKGRTVWVEVKRPDNDKSVQTPHQEAFEREVKAHDGEYIVARCLEDLAAAGMIDGIIGVGQ